MNLATGPDGALYVVDMYRELVEHPQFVPESARGRSTSAAGTIADGSGAYDPRLWPSSTGRKPGLSRAGIRELVGLLGHANAWWRGTSQRLLVERLSRDRPVNNERDTAVRLLCEVLKDTVNPLARLHALYTLLGVSCARFRDPARLPATVIPHFESMRSARPRRSSRGCTGACSQHLSSLHSPPTRRFASAFRRRWRSAIAAGTSPRRLTPWQALPHAMVAIPG